MRYEDFFQRATGHQPYPYQAALATVPTLAGALDVPTGLGKTAAATLAWLWRRQHGGYDEPRRLVFCLPMRTLVEQSHGVIAGWLDALDGALPEGRPDLHMLMGGESTEPWDRRPEKDAILVGTQDILLSHALNRGYGSSRFRWPTRFGLLNSDVLWVVDEVQLLGPGLATTTQLQALRRLLGTQGPTRTLWMSATLEPSWLRTVDTCDDDVAGLPGLSEADSDAAGHLLSARKELSLEPLEVGDSEALAQAIVASHRPGKRTLVVLNTVDRAVQLHDALVKGGSDAMVTLIHSRFRSRDRADKLAALLAEPGESGTIAVATQVVEAGVDLSAAVLWTEPAPWASLVQRFGRCNRRGEEPRAEVHVLRLPDDDKAAAKLALPYELDDQRAAWALLKELQDVGPAALPRVPLVSRAAVVLRRRDLLELFDTTGDLMGYETDISRFVRDADDRSLRVFWRDVEPSAGPGDEEPPPHRDELCSVPVHQLRARKGKKLPSGRIEPVGWIWQPRDGAWEALTRDGMASLYPGATVLLPANRGGYEPDRGWSKSSKKAVAVVAAPVADAAEQAHDDEVFSRGRDAWLPLIRHLADVEAEARGIGAAVGLTDALLEPLATAARWHDVGKAHPVFQRSLRGDAEDAPDAEVLLAKSRLGRIRHARKGFRHELASALRALDDGQPDLVAYLVAAHHGKVRLSIRALPDEPRAPSPDQRFARGVWEGDELPAVELPGGRRLDPCALTLSWMELGDDPETGPSWSSRALSLRDDPGLGPFLLAYLEALLKAADERASGAPR